MAIGYLLVELAGNPKDIPAFIDVRTSHGFYYAPNISPRGLKVTTRLFQGRKEGALPSGGIVGVALPSGSSNMLVELSADEIRCICFVFGDRGIPNKELDLVYDKLRKLLEVQMHQYAIRVVVTSDAALTPEEVAEIVTECLGTGDHIQMRVDGPTIDLSPIIDEDMPHGEITIGFGIPEEDREAQRQAMDDEQIDGWRRS